ncbi:MAG: PBP1A family penicillin-binding protein [Bryobacteraceae bacterium]
MARPLGVCQNTEEVPTSPKQRFLDYVDRLGEWLRNRTVFQKGLILAALGMIVVAGYVAQQFSALVDEKLELGPFAYTSNFYASPRAIARGDSIKAHNVIAELRQAGYTPNPNNPTGYYKLDGDSLEIFPGPRSYFKQEPAQVKFDKGRIDRIVTLNDSLSVNEYMIEPQLIANLAGENREKRRMVPFEMIPQVMVNALISAEDKRFFSHWGFDPLRVIKSAWVNFRSGERSQGGSTLTMQLARMLWLSQDKVWKRKITESLITATLEWKLSKEEIFEHYCNGIYLGQHETYSIHGFGQAARVYFSKDIENLTLPEAALLAGIVQRPSYFVPHRHPERAVARRNVVLDLMLANGFITQSEHDDAAKAPHGLRPSSADWGESPYFLALASQEMESRLGDKLSKTGAYRIYTTLDLGLQRAAMEAVTKGMLDVDKQLRARFGGRKWDKMDPPQAALIAIDPKTGEIKAAVGGRNYATSQFNHLTAKRQPGSIFKPLVYAAALNVRTKERGGPITPASVLLDEPRVFHFNRQDYEPHNYRDHYMGEVTLRQALSHSLNIATISLAEEIGYSRVVDLAKKAGLNDNILATPSMALGSYEATPIEMAGAYSMFANGGVHTRPRFLNMVRSSRGGPAILRDEAEQNRALESRIAYMMREMLEEVMRSGTGAGARSRGFNSPAGGKTGTSRDGWFAGFTSDLLCVVWVGFDDNTELELEGAKSALPIWTDFMKKAVAQSKYYARPFDSAPSGLISLSIDPESGYPAGPNCPTKRYDHFLSGQEPRGVCPLHSGGGDLPLVKVSAPGATH